MAEIERPCPAGCDNGAVLALVCCRMYLETGECCNQPDREDVACEVCDGAGCVVERASGGPSIETADTLYPYPMTDVDEDVQSESSSSLGGGPGEGP